LEEYQNKQNQQNQLQPRNERPWVRNMIFCFLIIGIIIALFYLTTSPYKKEISYETFVSDLAAYKIEQVEYTDYHILVSYYDGTKAYMGPANTELVQNSILIFNSTTETAKVSQFASLRESTDWTSLIFPIISLLITIAIIVALSKTINKSTKQSFDFTKNRARIAKSTFTFDDVAGADEEKEEVKEIVEFLKSPQRFTNMGARIPKGVLLVGPPGTGKTLLAKAIAGEAGVPFFSISGSDFMELFVGVGASRVRDLFLQAKQASPCIVFIDEIDAIGRQRGTGMGGGNDEREQTLNQLLVQMDGFETNEGIIVIAATNRADILDPALLRPGRFDRQIYIHVPDVKGREEILKVHAKNKKLDSTVDFKQIARITSGFTGAEIENLLNEAAIIATKQNQTSISMTDITEGIDKITMGPQKRSRVVTDRDREITAYHESGHAIVGKLIENSDPVHEISIVPRGNAAGYTVSRPDTDDTHITKSKLFDMITMFLAGRVAERLFLKDITTGASNDIERATALARRMVAEFGMSDTIGLMHMGSENSYFLGKDYMERNTYSEAYAEKIDTCVGEILQNAERQAEKILSTNKKIVNNMVQVLLAKETIYSDEVDMLMAKKTAKYVIGIIEERYKSAEEKKAEQKQKRSKSFTNLKESIVKSDEHDATKEPQDKTNIEILPSNKISENFEEALNETKKKKPRNNSREKI